jgi:MoaA/NifB/PqqE/SkfB family radical SAM enzyme
LPKGRRACIWCPPVEICCSPVPRYELVQRSDMGGDEPLCVLTQHDY